MSVGKLQLATEDVKRARSLARTVGRPIVRLAKQHTTVSVERATLRLAGLGGADADGTPWVNRLVDVVRADLHEGLDPARPASGLAHGVALPVWDALRRGEAEDLLTLAQKASAGSVRFRLPEGRDATYAVWDLPSGAEPADPSGFPVLDPGAELPTCTRTVVDGRTVHTVPHHGESS